MALLTPSRDRRCITAVVVAAAVGVTLAHQVASAVAESAQAPTGRLVKVVRPILEEVAVVEPSDVPLEEKAPTVL